MRSLTNPAITEMMLMSGTASARFIPSHTADEISALQLSGLKWTVAHAYAGSPFYRARLEEVGIAPGDITDLSDLTKLPFTTAYDLQACYPLPLLSVPEERVVRIHGSSGTTGKRKILTYTQKDIDDWANMFARCYELAGLTVLDRVQICVGYGLWTAGAGFQLGCERFGAMALPVGPGMLDIQLQMLTDLGATCLCSTASMALLLGEEVEKQNLRGKLKLKRSIFGAEAHTKRMRQRFEEALGLEHSFDISGMTEIYGPGAGIECEAHQGIHYWADMYILEIIDPETLLPVAPGELGEMVITSLKKEASPLIRYRTRDMTRLIPGACPCGCAMPRHERIQGRSDDMIIFRGVNIYPGQVAAVLEKHTELNSEYQLELSRVDGLDHMVVRVEKRPGAATDAVHDGNLASAVAEDIRSQILVRSRVEVLEPGTLPRSFAKTKRVIDSRDKD